jgi:predicted  nucleic acid-binding Zn-ribbon protein
MSKFLETSQFLKELNTLWDEHAVHIAKANANLNTMLKTAGKIPSAYISMLKEVTAAQNNVTKSSTKLNSVTAKQAQEITNLLAKRNALLGSNKSLNTAMETLEAKLAKANN